MAEFLFKDRITATPNRIKLTKVAEDTYDVEKIPGEVVEEGTPLNATTMNKLAQKDGTNTALMNTVFTEAATRANIASGETHATLFGKIRKWFSDLKAHAFNDLATALGPEEDKAPTNKLLTDTAALKFDKTSISTVMPISSDAASNEKVLGEKVVYDEFAKASRTIAYDKVIRTQDDFDALIADPTWLGATSVALVGQFTVSRASGIKIPDTVRQIHGFNNAKITVTDFVFNDITAKGGLWYDTRPTTLDYSIRDLEVDCTGTGTEPDYSYGFYNCTNLTNCTGTGTGGNNSHGFANCTNLTNCTGTGTGSSYGYGFYECTNLTNCTGKGTGVGDYGYGYGFNICTNLTNCTGTGTGDGYGYGYGFNLCTNLTNCTGKGTGGSKGYGFNNITYASNCRDGGSKTDMWGGTNKNINVETCRKTLVNADNTTLNT